MPLSSFGYAAAGGASLAAGLVNALAGGGTLISFPTLVAIGLPTTGANVTNAVALLPGYLSASGAQRQELVPQLSRVRSLALVAIAGGLAGSILLIETPEHAFRAVVPYLILLSCILLLAQERVRDWMTARSESSAEVAAGGGVIRATSPTVPVSRTLLPSPALAVAVFGAAVYGGFFGAGLGIMLLAVLGFMTGAPLVEANAAKQVLSFVITLPAAIFFAFSGHVRWQLVPIMAVASILGGFLGGRAAGRVNPTILRAFVVVVGLGVAITFWIS